MDMISAYKHLQPKCGSFPEMDADREKYKYPLILKYIQPKALRQLSDWGKL